MSKFGTSLLVPSVQELVKQPITKVPERYIRPNQDPPVVSNTASISQVPVIDLSKLVSEDVTELEKLDHACKDWGFFQLINHGVNPSLVDNVKRGVQEFFDLPMEEKKPFWQTPEDMQGFGQLFVGSEDQKLDWGDVFFITTLPSHTRNPRLFPSIPQPFRDNIENYSLEMKKLFIQLFGHMAIALKIEPNEVLEVFEDTYQTMRWNYYPLCPQPESVIGLNPHCDAGPLTILLQVNEVEGLEIKKDGEWIAIKPLPNALVVNIGDTSEILTNGIYRSIEHRATINSVKERISIATFHRPQMSRFIGPIESLVTPERPELFKRVTVYDYCESYHSSIGKGKSCLDSIRIQAEKNM